MKSRTPEGKHTKRFIILAGFSDGSFNRSGNPGLSQAFATREEAQAALDTPGNKSEGVTYRIRQK